MLWRYCAVVCTALFCTSAYADGLTDIKTRGALIWGADAEGGGPYIFENPKNTDEMIGYDILFAEALAKKLGVTPQFFQGSWDKLPSFLNEKSIDIITNGYEWDADRVKEMQVSIPYYVYGLQMMVQKDNTSITNWADFKKLNNGKKWRAGVLAESAGEFYLKENFPNTVEIVGFADNIIAMKDVVEGTLDFTAADTPIMRFFEPRFAKLKVVGDTVGKGHYVVYARKGETELIKQINAAILELVDTGEIEKIYSPYKMWDATTELELRCTVRAATKLANKNTFDLPIIAEICDPAASASSLSKVAALPQAEALLVSMTKDSTKKTLSETAPPTSIGSSNSASQPVKPAVQDMTAPDAEMRGFAVVEKYGVKMLRAARNTIILSVISFPLAILIGLLVALGRMYGPKALNYPLAAYVEFIRGTPLMLQLYIIYFFIIPAISGSVLDMPLKSLLASIIGLAINYGAYESEIYRAGLQAIPPGQMEAALSLGMTKGQALRRIIVPQALRITIPPTVNDFIALFKDTSVCSVIAITELTAEYSRDSKNNPGAFLEFVAMASILYLLMSYPLSIISRKIEKRLEREGAA
jgi:His/Glu/Gln/Arg/opine family amino acid ABC transporter permease subunit